MLGWLDVFAQQERYKDLLREAQSGRLVLHELALGERRDCFHWRVMSWLGRGLVAWGWRLQECYPTMNEAPDSQGARCTQPADERRPA